MAIIYCIGTNEHGYYGQDINGSSSDFPRIAAHIDYIFRNIKDSAADDIIRPAGIGGCHYGYWPSDNFFGIGSDVLEGFRQYYGLESVPEDMAMHLAEMCYIVANKNDLSESNKAIGGGGLKLDFSKGSPIQALENSHGRTALNGYDIDITFTKEGQVNVSDFVDLFPTNGGEIISLNKVLYAQKYACLRILTRIAPYYCLYIDYNNMGTVRDGIAENLIDLVLNPEQGKKKIKEAFSNKFKKICNDLSNDMNSWLFAAGASFKINLLSAFNLNSGNASIETMADYIATHLSSGISSAIRAYVSKTHRVTKRDVNFIENKFFTNRSTKEGSSEQFKATFRMSRDNILIAAKGTDSEPKWGKLAQERCAGKRPVLRVDDNFIKKIAYKNFVAVLDEEANNKPLGLKPDQINNVATKDFLMYRVEAYYHSLFGNNASVFYDGEMSFRALASIRNPGFEQIDFDDITNGIIVRSPNGYEYKGHELWDIYNKWASKSFEDVPLGGF